MIYIVKKLQFLLMFSLFYTVSSPKNMLCAFCLELHMITNLLQSIIYQKENIKYALQFTVELMFRPCQINPEASFSGCWGVFSKEKLCSSISHSGRFIQRHAVPLKVITQRSHWRIILETYTFIRTSYPDIHQCKTHFIICTLGDVVSFS